MPAYALQLLIALALAGLTFFVSYPLAVGGGRAVDALDAFLLVFALVNLRIAWSAANGAYGGRAPLWFVLAGLGTAALIATAISAPPGSRPCAQGGPCGVAGLIASAIASEGSVANVAAIQEDRVESGLVQGDVAALAQMGAAQRRAAGEHKHAHRDAHADKDGDDGRRGDGGAPLVDVETDPLRYR